MNRLYECDLGEGHHLYVVATDRPLALAHLHGWAHGQHYDGQDGTDWDAFNAVKDAITERTRGFDPVEYVEIPDFAWSPDEHRAVPVKLPCKAPVGSSWRSSVRDTAYIEATYRAEAHVWAAKLTPGVVLSVAP